jgi:muramoyltetrapeptide carboxypeptidase
MRRKQFLGLSASLIGGMALPVKKAIASTVDEETVYTKPPFLKQGDIIGITSPAGYITLEEIKPAISVMESWGYKVKIGTAIGKRDFTRGGTETERASDLQQMLDDNSIKAIMCARGGYGSISIVDKLNWTRFKAKPKWVIGFSDVTVLHNHIHRNCQVASIHSKMCNSFPDNWNKAEAIQVQTINSIRDALAGKKMKYTAMPNVENKTGTAEGILIGGNLKTIETLSGTASDINTTGKLLFVEDTFEYLYSIDRMFWNLKRTGKLKGLKGLIVGGFNAKPDDPGEEFGKTLQEIVLEKVKKYNYPVCFDFPVGHQRANFALKCGVSHKLTVNKEQTLLAENG